MLSRSVPPGCCSVVLLAPLRPCSENLIVPAASFVVADLPDAPAVPPPADAPRHHRPPPHAPPPPLPPAQRQRSYGRLSGFSFRWPRCGHRAVPRLKTQRQVIDVCLAAPRPVGPCEPGPEAGEQRASRSAWAAVQQFGQVACVEELLVGGAGRGQGLGDLGHGAPATLRMRVVGGEQEELSSPPFAQPAHRPTRDPRELHIPSAIIRTPRPPAPPTPP